LPEPASAVGTFLAAASERNFRIIVFSHDEGEE